MNSFFGFLPNDIVNLHFYKTARVAWLIVTKAELWNIVKKWAKTGNLDSGDIIRGSILLADMLSKDKNHDKKGKLKRRSFSQTVQKLTLRKQAYRCNMCTKKLDEVNFDHIDGTRSNNSIANCQALCPNCHAKKTRERNKMKARN